MKTLFSWWRYLSYKPTTVFIVLLYSSFLLVFIPQYLAGVG